MSVPPCLLIIRGVRLSDFNEIRSTPQSKPEPTVNYTALPTRFTGVASWPQTTNLKCVNCDLVPVSYPRFIPKNAELVAGNDECDVEDVFCSWNCAATTIRCRYAIEMQWDLLAALCHIESLFTGRRRLIIPNAPSKTLMQAYCGPNGITPKQWRELLEKINSDYDLTVYKIDHEL